MTLIGRLALPWRRRVIADSMSTPRVRPQATREGDDLDSARGVLTGVLIGVAMWIAIIAWITWS
jgi:hypothetical protein